MALCLSLLVLMIQTPAVKGIHPEWGPEPPVAPYGQDDMPAQQVVIPMVFPVLATVRMDNGYNEQRGGFKHTGIDIRGPKMSPVVAPISGKLGLKKDTFWIYGDDGWAVLGTHLNDDNPGKHDHAASLDLMFAPNLVAGQEVYAGQFLGYLGESGDATAPHLHFEIYEPGDGTTMSRIRNPFASLKAATVIKTPIVQPKPKTPPKGLIRYQGCIRKIEKDKGMITVILVSKATVVGDVSAITQPKYLRVHLSPDAIADAGGWDALSRLPQTSEIGLVLVDSVKLDDATVTRIDMPASQTEEPSGL